MGGEICFLQVVNGEREKECYLWCIRTVFSIFNLHDRLAKVDIIFSILLLNKCEEIKFAVSVTLCLRYLVNHSNPMTPLPLHDLH